MPLFATDDGETCSCSSFRWVCTVFGACHISKWNPHSACKNHLRPKWNGIFFRYSVVQRQVDARCTKYYTNVERYNWRIKWLIQNRTRNKTMNTDWVHSLLPIDLSVCIYIRYGSHFARFRKRVYMCVVTMNCRTESKIHGHLLRCIDFSLCVTNYMEQSYSITSSFSMQTLHLVHRRDVVGFYNDCWLLFVSAILLFFSLSANRSLLCCFTLRFVFSPQNLISQRTDNLFECRMNTSGHFQS